ncbi:MULTISPECIES: hypothetical protein [unclassified Iodidimonas]|jgi:hypothetical protein|uniref:hypothetical protein n=2 Tax=Iodidimonas TaxID=2066486 RepID=UPI00248223AF|nr:MULTISPECIES: hypothetical protein [unclassified Iodidimonas]
MMAAPAFSARRRRLFLDALRDSANVSASARHAGIARRDVYRLRAKDTAFRDEWDHALEEALDALEGELRRRAVHGVEKPVFYAGKPCGKIISYSDQLGMFLLRSRRPHIFGSESSLGPDPAEGDTHETRNRLQSLLDRLAQSCGADEEDEGRDGNDQPLAADTL